MAGGRRSHGQGTFWGDLIGPNPTDRGKAGTKRSLLVDGEGGPLSIVVAGANVHDAKLLEATLDAIVVERPQPTEEEPQHLCLDKGYDNPSGRGAAAGHGYTEHIRRIGEEKLDASGDKRYPARRWVVERTLAWLSKCRAVLVRYDKKAANYLGVLHLASVPVLPRWSLASAVSPCGSHMLLATVVLETDQCICGSDFEIVSKYYCTRATPGILLGFKRLLQTCGRSGLARNP